MLVLGLRTIVIRSVPAFCHPRLLSSFKGATMASVLSNKKSPEGVVVNWDFTHFNKEQILDLTNKLTSRFKQTIDDVVASPTVSFDTVLKPLLDSERWFRNEAALLTFPSQVAVSAELRDASRDAQNLLDEVIVEVSMRADVYQKLIAYKDKAQDDKLTPEQKRAMEKLIRDYRRNGVNLDETTRAEIKSIKTQLNEKGLEFSKNLAEDKWEKLFSESDLAGMPSSFLEGLDKDEATGMYKVSLKYPHIFPITKKCRVPETRKILATANASKAMEPNTKLLEEMINLREKEAKLLGYKNHAEFVQEELMAKCPQNVETFLRDLAKKLNVLWNEERATMLSLKKKECETYGFEFNGKLDPWDTRYYIQKIEETVYSVDPEEYKPYFPMEQVTSGLLKIYQLLLNLKFTLLTDAPVWHPDVQVYEVRDGSDSSLLGYFYLDMYPRDGKYNHACCVPNQMSCLDDEGKRIPAVLAMLCNFTKPQANKPALLDHSEVETYFHEFGHLMHSICSNTETAMFSGAPAVERDFLECPSQMLENWVWHEAPLSLMSKHYETGKTLPSNMVQKLVDSKKANAGVLNLRQVVLGLFDQNIHTTIGGSSTAQTYADTTQEILGMDEIPGTNFAATFGHLAHGYSARYYSYLWSEVFSMDMFETGFGDQLMDPTKGLHYRRTILEPGGSLDADVMLRNFLGRDPKPEPFLRSKGITVIE